MDEIQGFVDTRHIAAHEALWRIFEFRTHGHSVPVLQLDIYLANQQMVAIRAEQALELRLARDIVRKSTLTAFFTENARFPTSILYQDFPAHYIWDRKRKT